MMKAFVSLATLIVLAGCSSGKSGDSSHNPASEKISGRLVPEVQSIQHQPAAQQLLEAWQNECHTVDGFNVPGLRAGMQFRTREDSVSLWQDLKPKGETRTREHAIESVTSAKEFMGTLNQISQNYSILARFRYTAGVGTYSSEMVSIISTNPPSLKSQIEKVRNQPSQDHINCRSARPDGSPTKRDVAFATLTLQSGQAVNGILVVESNEFTDYKCSLYRNGNSLVREEMMSARGIEERIQFFSKDIVNPFEARCHDDASLLSVRSVRDLSGTNGIFSLDKSEVLGF